MFAAKYLLLVVLVLLFACGHSLLSLSLLDVCFYVLLLLLLWVSLFVVMVA